MAETRCCIKCETTKPVADFPKDMVRKTGQVPIMTCRACRYPPKPHDVGVPVGHRRCKTCGAVKVLVEGFYPTVRGCFAANCKVCRNKQIAAKSDSPEGRKKACEKVKRYQKTDKGKESQRRAAKKRLETEIGRIATSIRGSLRRALAIAGAAKSGHTEALVGCSWEQLVVHIQKQFVTGMTWENQGVAWQVDHRRPLASFNLFIPREQRKACHWTNLQPMFGPDNIRKSSWWEGVQWRYDMHSPPEEEDPDEVLSCCRLLFA